MINMVAISVYILCHNYADFVGDAIDSVFGQIFEDWELIIINDGSNDNSQEIIDGYQLKFPGKIKAFQNDASIGLAASANKALEHARGEYVIRLDADDKFTDTALLSLYHRAQKRDHPSFVFGGYFYINQAGGIVGFENILQETKLVASAFPPHGACTLIRKRTLLQIGGYDENLTSQDGWDVWFRANGADSFAVVASPIFYYRQHGGSLSRKKEKLIDSRLRLFERMQSRMLKNVNRRVGFIIPIGQSEIDAGPVHTLINKLKESSLYPKSVQKHEVYITSTIPKADLDERFGLESEAYQYIKRGSAIDHRDHRAIIESSVVHLAEQGGCDIWCYLNLHATEWDNGDFKSCMNFLLSTEFDQILTVEEERSPILRFTEKGVKLVGEGKFNDRYSSVDHLFRFNGCLIMGWLDRNGIEIFSDKLGYWEMS